MSGREEVLRRIRVALRDAPAAPPITRTYQTADRTPAHGAEDLRHLLEDRLVDYRARVRRCAESEVAAAVADALTARGIRRIAVPDGVPPAWLERLPADLQLVRDDPPLSVRDLDQLDGVLTSCSVAIAETGTVVLDAGPGQGRRALTLLPDYHLVVVSTDQVVATVPRAVARLDPTRPLTWISGPSATSDIELTRVEGVHGPRTLEVILLT